MSFSHPAESVITKNQDMKEAMSFLEECPLIKIEDILPFFSDVVTIDHFRQPICESLQVKLISNIYLGLMSLANCLFYVLK